MDPFSVTNISMWPFSSVSCRVLSEWTSYGEEMERKWGNGEREKMAREWENWEKMRKWSERKSLSPFSLSLHCLILSPFPFHFLSIFSFALHFLFIYSFSLYFLGSCLPASHRLRHPANLCTFNTIHAKMIYFTLIMINKNVLAASRSVHLLEVPC